MSRNTFLFVSEESIDCKVEMSIDTIRYSIASMVGIKILQNVVFCHVLNLVV